MKIAIVTFIRAYNYGAILQCYALQKKLQSFGLDIEVLDYNPKYFYDLYRLKNIAFKMRRRPYRPLRVWAKYQIAKYLLYKRNASFEHFISKNIRLSQKQFSSKADLDNSTELYDGYIVGSDQVWNNNLTNSDPVFFLGWNHPKDPLRFSYSASFGDVTIPDGALEERKTLLEGWNGYSVREECGIDLIRELTGESAVLCCDPTLLLTSHEWDSVITNRKKRDKPYILVYYVNNADNVLSYAFELSKQKELDVFVLSSITQEEQLLGTKAKQRGFRYKVNVAPNEFVAYIKDAAYVISDSFHGTVLSILYHKQFYTVQRFVNGATNIRAIELMNRVGIYKTFDSIEKIDEPIDWDSVDLLLEEYRAESIDYLHQIASMINGVE